MKRLSVILFFLILLPLASAKPLHMPILAVQNPGTENATGSVANLYFESQYGLGRIFIETIPLTKIDTQMSTRFANRLACEYAKKDCTKKDFFYTIRAEAPIIGGPSASAAIAIITVANLDNLKIKPNASITGTISSGYLIGPVGGIKEKIEGAAKHGIKTVLIPKGERNYTKDNITIDLIEYGNNLTVTVIEVSTLGEALKELTGKDYRKKDKPLKVSQKYTDTMKNLTELLCSRSEELTLKLKLITTIEGNTTIDKQAKNLTIKGKKAYKDYQYYSAASYCFGANVRLSTIIAQKINFTKNITEIKKFESIIDNQKIESLTDLETYMVVKERIIESLETNEPGYSKERLNSAIAWSKFFGTTKDSFTLDTHSLKQGCIEKLNEAEENYQYLQITYPIFNIDREEYELAKKDYENEEYALCLFKATKAKSKYTSILSIIGIEDEKAYLERKINAAKNQIQTQIEEGRFPIIGYSYYEYANTLKESNPYSAALYAEYALELSNLNIYFKKKTFPFYFNNLYILIYLTGIATGVIIGFFVRKK